MSCRREVVPMSTGRFLLLIPMTFSPMLRARRISSACHGEIIKPVRHCKNCDDGVTSQSIGQSSLSDQRCKRGVTFGGWCAFNQETCQKWHRWDSSSSDRQGIKEGGGEGYKMYWEEPGYVFRRCASCFFFYHFDILSPLDMDLLENRRRLWYGKGIDWNQNGLFQVNPSADSEISVVLIFWF